MINQLGQAYAQAHGQIGFYPLPFYGSSLAHALSHCIHGDECPVCRAKAESDEISGDIRKKEYAERCEKYMQEWREKRKVEVK